MRRKSKVVDVSLWWSKDRMDYSSSSLRNPSTKIEGFWVELWRWAVINSGFVMREHQSFDTDLKRSANLMAFCLLLLCIKIYMRVCLSGIIFKSIFYLEMY